MPDDLYWNDTLEWSERQSALLRRLAAGERVNGVDWGHVIEEIEDVGRSELRACSSLLRRAIEQLLKLRGWPDSVSAQHWRGEALGFLADAALAFSPSMEQRIDIGALYRRAARDTAKLGIDGKSPASPPDVCPFAVSDLLSDEADLDALVARLEPTPAEYPRGMDKGSEPERE